MAIETREQAMAEAVRRYGEKAVVGHGRPISRWDMVECYYVGWKETGAWIWLGMGTTWDEAFESVLKVKLVTRDKVEFEAASK